MEQKKYLPKLLPTGENLIPNTVNPTPDYYCTWQTQLYATSDGRPKRQREIISEHSMFDRSRPNGWAYFYEKARGDLLFIMDDSWDVPPYDDPAFYGSLIPDREKFPDATRGNAAPGEALKRLTARMRALGWKGLGGWVCAQEAPAEAESFSSPEDYWTARLRDAAYAGFSYWKVDWGKKAADADFRRMLTALGKKYAPELIIEHAMIKSLIPHADVYRTYDVPALMSIPMTMEKLRDFTDVPRPEDGCMGLINCEDEAYIAAAGGFSMGIMRHPYRGALPNGSADPSFPALHRRLKTKMTEVLRAVHWHRIAPAFGVDQTEFRFDTQLLTDSWQFEKPEEEIESWWMNMPQIRDFLKDGRVEKTAPARFSRRTALPEAAPDRNGSVPYLAACAHPNGAFSVLAAGRTCGRTYEIPRCAVRADSGAARTVGVFGSYASLSLKTALDLSHIRVLAQDLAGETAFDITAYVSCADGSITLPGALIEEIGTAAQPSDDTSEPGLVLALRSNGT